MRASRMPALNVAIAFFVDYASVTVEIAVLGAFIFLL